MLKIEARIKKTISDILISNSIDYCSISIFGSRARQDNKPDSDFDILIITKNDIKREIKSDILKKIRQDLSVIYINEGLIAGSDVIMKSQEEVKYYKNKPGSLIRNAVKERKLL